MMTKEINNMVNARKNTKAANSVKRAAAPRALKSKANGNTHKKTDAEQASLAILNNLETVPTTIEARMDIGYGNILFIRGQGAGLTWDKGMPLQCVAQSTWVWSTREAKDKLVFKLLLNDQQWAQGEDHVVEAGNRLEINPVFP